MVVFPLQISTNVPVTLVRMKENAQIRWMGTSVTAQQDTQECIVKPVSFYASIMIMIGIKEIIISLFKNYKYKYNDDYGFHFDYDYDY